MREDLEHNFDKAEFNNSCGVMKCVKQLFPHSEKQAETQAVFCYESWTAGEGGTPEQQRDRRNPKWKKSLELFEKRRQKTKLYYYYNARPPSTISRTICNLLE